MNFPVSINMLLCHTRIYINEVSIRTSPLKNDSVCRIVHTEASWYRSSERYDSIVRCLQATKEYLDHFLRMSPEAIPRIPMPDFLRLIYAVLILGSLATTCNLPPLDSAHIREIAEFESYIIALSHKTTQTITTISPTDTAHGHMRNLRHLWQTSKPWYAQFINKDELGYAIIGGQDLSFMDIFSTIITRCSSFPGSLRSGH